MDELETLTQIAYDEDLLFIDDSKLADIGSTNEAGIYYTQKKHIDAVTLACFAGNREEAARQCKKYDVGGIHMCMMSNSEYTQEKDKLVPLTEEQAREYELSDLLKVEENPM